MFYRYTNVPGIFYLVTVKMTVYIQAPSTEAVRVDRYVRHYPTLALNVSTNIIE
jgi:hypothetical protein